MEVVAIAAFVFVVGLTACGLCGTLIEIFAGRRLSLREPFISAGFLSRSLVLVLLAGPYMTANEAIAARFERRIDGLLFAAIIGFCVMWLLATGIFVVGLAGSARESLG